MKPLEKITKAVQKACPELLELSFGCEVEELTVFKKKYFVTYIEPHYVYATSIEGDKLQMRKHQNYKILGHPIQLQHVLRAIDKHNGHIFNVYFRDDGRFGLLEQDDEYHHFRTGAVAYWDLTKDLNGQSEETLTFLSSLL